MMELLVFLKVSYLQTHSVRVTSLKYKSYFSSFFCNSIVVLECIIYNVICSADRI